MSQKIVEVLFTEPLALLVASILLGGLGVVTGWFARGAGRKKLQRGESDDLITQEYRLQVNTSTANESEQQSPPLLFCRIASGHDSLAKFIGENPAAKGVLEELASRKPKGLPFLRFDGPAAKTLQNKLVGKIASDSRSLPFAEDWWLLVLADVPHPHHKQFRAVLVRPKDLLLLLESQSFVAERKKHGWMGQMLYDLALEYQSRPELRQAPNGDELFQWVALPTRPDSHFNPWKPGVELKLFTSPAIAEETQ